MTRGYANRSAIRKWSTGWFAVAAALSAAFSVMMAVIIGAGAATPLYPANAATIHSAGLSELATNWVTLATPTARSLPLTLEVEAGIVNTDQWGIWVTSGGTFYVFYVRSDGYFRTSGLDWQPFDAVRPDVNKLYLYLDLSERQEAIVGFPALYLPPKYEVTFRINDEIA